MIYCSFSCVSIQQQCWFQQVQHSRLLLSTALLWQRVVERASASQLEQQQRATLQQSFKCQLCQDSSYVYYSLLLLSLYSSSSQSSQLVVALLLLVERQFYSSQQLYYSSQLLLLELVASRATLVATTSRVALLEQLEQLATSRVALLLQLARVVVEQQVVSEYQ